jgi:hypothetical protein
LKQDVNLKQISDWLNKLLTTAQKFVIIVNINKETIL